MLNNLLQMHLKLLETAEATDDLTDNTIVDKI